MASSPLRTSLLKLSMEHLSIVGARNYHSELAKVPDVPLPIHDLDYQLFPENGQPFNLFVPDLSEVNYDDFKSEVIIRFNDSVTQSQRILKRTSHINLILTLNHAIRTARGTPNRIWKNNYFISNEGIITVDKLFRLEKFTASASKMKSSAKDKLSEISSKLPDTSNIAPQVVKAWEDVKLKLPDWQKSIVNKLQSFQNKINRKLPPPRNEKKEEEEC